MTWYLHSSLSHSLRGSVLLHLGPKSGLYMGLCWQHREWHNQKILEWALQWSSLTYKSTEKHSWWHRVQTGWFIRWLSHVSVAFLCLPLQRCKLTLLRKGIQKYKNSKVAQKNTDLNSYLISFSSFETEFISITPFANKLFFLSNT